MAPVWRRSLRMPEVDERAGEGGRGAEGRVAGMVLDAGVASMGHAKNTTSA